MGLDLTAGEANRHEKVHSFSACRHAGHWLCSWIHAHGRITGDGTECGAELVVMKEGARPRTVTTGVSKTLAAAWSPGCAHFAVQRGRDLLLGCSSSLLTERWLQLPDDEEFVGLPVWVNADVILFATSGGTPECRRLYAAARPPGSLHQIGDDWRYMPKTTYFGDSGCTHVMLFNSRPLANIISWDHSPTLPIIVLVHQRSNNPVADVVVIPGVLLDKTMRSKLEGPHVIAMTSMEYCPPQVAFLGDARLAGRLNLVRGKRTSTEFLGHGPLDVVHGMWLLELQFSNGDIGTHITPMHIMPGLPHGSYDVYSGSYCGDHGVREGFLLSEDRSTLVVAARRQSVESTADALFRLEIGKDASAAEGKAIPSASLAGKGCYVPVALSGDILVYHFRSPVQWGDLWSCNASKPDKKPIMLTHTMPHSLQQKLRLPQEVVILNPESGKKFHALMFQPPDEAGEDKCTLRQPLVWAHGGPHLHYSYDYNPLLSWLACLGFVTVAPNFRGSTGFGVEFMNSVHGDGCGVADVSDCAACVHFLRALQARRPELRLDLRRGVGIAGHSWGGYLALMCSLQRSMPGAGGADTEDAAEPPFSCAVASAAITDWALQQSDTWNSAFTTHSLMGGNVQSDSLAAERASRAAPITYAENLRAPVLMLHGEEDVEVPFEQCRRFVKAASRSQHPRASLMCVAYPNEGHGIRSWSKSTQEDALKQISGFLYANLKQGRLVRQQQAPPVPASRAIAAAGSQKDPQHQQGPMPNREVAPAAVLIGTPPFAAGGYSLNLESGWEYEHAGGDWLFSRAEDIYFHVSTGLLAVEVAGKPGTFTQAKGGQAWRVVGGEDTGGILVRAGSRFDSPKESQRLGVGTLIVELELEGERLRYRRLLGSGPPTGWVSKCVLGKDLLVRVAPGLRDLEGGCGFGKRVQLRVVELFEEALDLEWSVVACEECSQEGTMEESKPTTYPAAVEMVLDKADEELVHEPPCKTLHPPKGSFVKRVNCGTDTQVTITSMPDARSFLISVLLDFEGRGLLRSAWTRVSTLDPRRRPRSATDLDPGGTRRARGITQRCDGFVDYGRELVSTDHKVRCRRCACDYDLHEIGWGKT